MDTPTEPIATLNPLRYRGYVYDTETGLYYLQSRYYDPTIGRFINADNYVATGQGLLGNNMFAYCGDNPIMFVDPAGAFWFPFISPIRDPLIFFSDCFRFVGATVPAVPQKDYDDFLDALAMCESSGDLDIVNQHGFQGLYQMGTDALIDAGFMNFSGEWTELANSFGVYSQETYLSNPAAQKVAVTNFHKKVCGYIRSYGLDAYIGTEYQGVEVTLSGLVSACHLVGTWNMREALRTGNIVKDGNGVPASYYMSIFAGYNMAAVWED